MAVISVTDLKKSMTVSCGHAGRLAGSFKRYVSESVKYSQVAGLSENELVTAIRELGICGI